MENKESQQNSGGYEIPELNGQSVPLFHLTTTSQFKQQLLRHSGASYMVSITHHSSLMGRKGGKCPHLTELNSSRTGQDRMCMCTHRLLMWSWRSPSPDSPALAAISLCFTCLHGLQHLMAHRGSVSSSEEVDGTLILVRSSGGWSGLEFSQH